MKKHLQFNDITALSLGWRAARRKAERERRGEREKEQSSSSLLCIFIKENITSFPLLFSFLSPFAFLSHSFTFCSFLSFSPLCSLLPFSPPIASHHPLPIVSPDPSARPIHVFFFFIFFLPRRSRLSNNVSFFFFFFSRAPLPTPPPPQLPLRAVLREPRLSRRDQALKPAPGPDGGRGKEVLGPPQPPERGVRQRGALRAVGRAVRWGHGAGDGGRRGG